MDLSSNSRIRKYLLEINIYRRLWKSWNEHGHKNNLNSIEYQFLLQKIFEAFFFVVIIRLYAITEGKKSTYFTFGEWLSSLNQTQGIKTISEEYKQLISSIECKNLRINRCNLYAHNLSKPKILKQSFANAFKISQKLEELYNRVADDGQALSEEWTGQLPTDICNDGNCKGGIEQNVENFFNYFYKNSL